MPENNLGMLNSYLFDELDRLNDPELKDEELRDEISRANTVSKVSQTIINNGNLVLEAQKATDNFISGDTQLPKMLDGEF